MASIYKDKYKEGDSFDSYKKVTTLKEAYEHPLVGREGVELHEPNTGWQTDGYMCRINLSSEGIYYWVSGEIGEHMASINVYGDTKEQAIEEACWVLNESFKYKESEELG